MKSLFQSSAIVIFSAAIANAATLSVDLDANLGATNTATTFTWIDQAATGGVNTFTKVAAPANQPIHVSAGGPNGEDYVDFSGDDNAQAAEFFNFPNYTMYVVARVSALPASYGTLFWDYGDDIPNNKTTFMAITSTGKVAAFVRDVGGDLISVEGGVVSIGVWSVFTARMNGTALDVFQNGTLVASGVNPAYDPTTWEGSQFAPTIGSFPSVTANFLNGGIAQLMIYNGAHTDGERLAIEQGLGTRYGINVVPEPASASLATGGLVVLFGWARPRRKMKI